MRNYIPRATTVTDFSKTFLVFYKWPDLTDVQVVLRSTVLNLVDLLTIHRKLTVPTSTILRAHRYSTDARRYKN
jgi:hypothetical protein